jgi:hypothetical protein
MGDAPTSPFREGGHQRRPAVAIPPASISARRPFVPFCLGRSGAHSFFFFLPFFWRALPGANEMGASILSIRGKRTQEKKKE